LAVAALALVFVACSSRATTKSVENAALTSATLQRSGNTTAPQPSAGQVLAPSGVASIVSSDTAVNNRANATLSITLQDSHESCLQQVLDDATYRGTLAAGSGPLGGSFDQVPEHAFVPRESSYPAFFSVLAKDQAASQSTTNNLLTYVKTSSTAKWKLASSSEILGPTAAGVTVPTVATDGEGYATSLAPTSTDGLVTAPAKVAAELASAFTSEAASGKLPPGISAQFGPNDVADPHSIATSYGKLGTVTTQFTSTTPAAAAAGAPSADCPYPAYRLSDGGALVTFAIFSKTVIDLQKGEIVIQPPDRSALGALLAPGNYSSVTFVTGDIGVAVVPRQGSSSPIDVIGQATEGLTETGVSGTGSPSAVGANGPSDAPAIAKSVDPKLVDIDTTLNFENAKAAGTGIVLTSNGEILTNNHVIESASSISVTDIGNGKTYGAKVVGYDRTSDVAVLKLENASGLQAVGLGNSSSVHTGEKVVAIGNAGGTGGTPSYAGGSVTALDQSISASDEGDATSEKLTGLIQSNADIEPGDSGGPLVTTGGKVIAMDTAASAGFSFDQGGASATQGYSIPVNTALKIAGEIEAGKSSSVVHIGPTAFLGVSVAAPSSAGSSFGGFGQPVPAPSSTGAEIASIVAGSPASHAGLTEGDTVIAIAGRSVTVPSSLTTILAAEKPGASVPVVYFDPSGAKHTVTVQLASGPPQ
jgi:S1-C subfamily serine protease